MPPLRPRRGLVAGAPRFGHPPAARAHRDAHAAAGLGREPVPAHGRGAGHGAGRRRPSRPPPC
eukprot:10154348-Lingulodinium_polyedra.AAC.1